MSLTWSEEAKGYCRQKMTEWQMVGKQNGFQGFMRDWVARDGAEEISGVMLLCLLLRTLLLVL